PHSLSRSVLRWWPLIHAPFRSRHFEIPDGLASGVPGGPNYRGAASSLACKMRGAAAVRQSATSEADEPRGRSFPIGRSLSVPIGSPVPAAARVAPVPPRALEPRVLGLTSQTARLHRCLE